MCKIKIALSKLSEKNFSRKWPSLWAKPIDTLENWVVKLPCRRSMIPGSRMQLWTFWVDRTYQRDIKPVPALSCGGVFRYRSGERLHGMQEVSGSIPLFSTKKALYFVGSMVLFFFCSSKKIRNAQLAMQAGQWHPRSQSKPLSDLTLAVFSAPRRQLHAKNRLRISELHPIC